MPPQTNATLDRVNDATAATGGRDDWYQPAGGEPAGAGGLKWTGPADAYLRETVQRTAGVDEATTVNLRTLYVDTAVALAAGIDTDDVITYTGPDGVQRTGLARTVARATLDGIPSRLATTRLDLEDR